jgi:hypothetical protein
MRELNPLRRHPIDVRRLDVRRTKAAEILIPLIVGKNQHDVGPRRIGGKTERTGESQQGKQKRVGFHGKSPEEEAVPKTNDPLCICGQDREIGIAAKLRCAVQHARLAPHQQTVYATVLHRRKDFEYRVPDQACLPVSNKSPKAARFPASAVQESSNTIPPIRDRRNRGYRSCGYSKPSHANPKPAGGAGVINSICRRLRSSFNLVSFPAECGSGLSRGFARRST